MRRVTSDDASACESTSKRRHVLKRGAAVGRDVFAGCLVQLVWSKSPSTEIYA